ncbi:MAG: hydrogenase maturation nickel metallochaperone HypA [Methanolinea sp.]|nr:hydrogenase maturation nickel metallochaperone HypA [Methanolinea sp.]
MHEFGIAYDIYATARKAALERKAREVRSVHVEFGEMAMVNPEQVAFLYGTLVEDDPLMKDSTLTWSVVAPLTRCSCGYEGSERFVCPRCGKLPELVRGREVTVTHMEIEVDDE